MLEVLGLKKEQANLIYICLSFSLFVFSFIRWEDPYNSYSDWGNYYEYFIDCLQTDKNNTFEWGYVLLNKLVRTFTDNYTVLLFFLGIILFSFQTVAIKILSPYPIMSLFILWAVKFGNILFVRQSIAISILLFSVKYLKERSFAKFLILVILASSFHSSSYLFILAWWVYPLKLSFKRISLILFFAVLFSFFLFELMNMLEQLTRGVINTNLSIYMNDSYNDMQETEMNSRIIIIRGIISKIFILILLFLFRKYFNSEQNGLLNLFLLGVLVYLLFTPLSIVFARFSYPFENFQIILFPVVLLFLKNRNNKLIYFIVLSVYIWARMYSLLVGVYSKAYIPFETIFN